MLVPLGTSSWTSRFGHRSWGCFAARGLRRNRPGHRRPGRRRAGGVQLGAPGQLDRLEATALGPAPDRVRMADRAGWRWLTGKPRCSVT